MKDHPSIISADATYDTWEIYQYSQNQGITSNIPVNRRLQRHPKQGRPVLFDWELYKKRSVIERFVSWIEAFKKITSRYEHYETWVPRPVPPIVGS